MGNQQTKTSLNNEIRSKSKFFHTLPSYLTEYPHLDATRTQCLADLTEGNVEDYVNSYLSTCQKDGTRCVGTAGYDKFHCEHRDLMFSLRTAHNAETRAKSVKKLQLLQEEFSAAVNTMVPHLFLGINESPESVHMVSEGLFVYLWKNTALAKAFVRGMQLAVHASPIFTYIPMIGLVNCRGFAVTVSTIILPNDNVRSHILTSPLTNLTAHFVADALNIGLHMPVESSLTEVPEVALRYGWDGRIYCVDCSALFPRIPYGSRYCVARTELLNQYVCDTHLRQSEIRSSLVLKMTVAVSVLAKKLDGLTTFQGFNLADEMHVAGLNIRKLGVLFLACTSPAARRFVGTELLCRTVKVLLRYEWRRSRSDMTVPITNRFFRACVGPENLWDTLVVPTAVEYFCLPPTEAHQLMSCEVDIALFLRRCCTMLQFSLVQGNVANVVVTPGTWVLQTAPSWNAEKAACFLSLSRMENPSRVLWCLWKKTEAHLYQGEYDEAIACVTDAMLLPGVAAGSLSFAMFEYALGAAHVGYAKDNATIRNALQQLDQATTHIAQVTKKVDVATTLRMMIAAALTEIALTHNYEFEVRLKPRLLTMQEYIEATKEYVGASTVIEFVDQVGRMMIKGLMSAGLFPESLQCAHTLLNALTSAFGPSNDSVVQVECEIATINANLEKFQEASDALRTAVNYYSSKLGPQHPKTALTKNNLACVYFAHARQLMNKASSPTTMENSGNKQKQHTASSYAYFPVDVRDSIHDAEIILTELVALPEEEKYYEVLCDSYNNLASVYMLKGNLTAAEQCYQRSVIIGLRVHAENHQDIVEAMKSMRLIDVKRQTRGAMTIQALFRRYRQRKSYVAFAPCRAIIVEEVGTREKLVFSEHDERRGIQTRAVYIRDLEMAFQKVRGADQVLDLGHLQLTDDNIAMLAERLCMNCTVTNIKLDVSLIQSAAFEKFMDIIETRNVYLHTIVLTGRVQFAEKTLQRIESLSTARRMRNTNIETLAKSIRAKTNAAVVNVSNAALTDDSVAVVLRAMVETGTSCTVTGVVLSNNGFLTDACVPHIVQGLRAIPTFTAVDVFGTAITKQQNDLLQQIVAYNQGILQLTKGRSSHVSFSGLQLGDAELRHINDALMSCKSIESIDLSLNDFSDTVMLDCFHVFAHHKQLRNVEVSGNPRVTVKTARMFGDLNQERRNYLSSQQKHMFVTNALKSIEADSALVVEMTNVNLNDDDFATLLVVLKKTTRTQKVILNNNRLTDAIIPSLCTLIKELPQLIEVQLTANNGIRAENIALVQGLCYVNSAIQRMENGESEIDVSSHPITDDMVIQLSHALARTTTVRSFTLSNNPVITTAVPLSQAFQSNPYLLRVMMENNPKVPTAQIQTLQTLTAQRADRENKVNECLLLLRKKECTAITLSNLPLTIDHVKLIGAELAKNVNPIQNVVLQNCGFDDVMVTYLCSTLSGESVQTFDLSSNSQITIRSVKAFDELCLKLSNLTVFLVQKTSIDEANQKLLQQRIAANKALRSLVQKSATSHEILLSDMNLLDIHITRLMSILRHMVHLEVVDVRKNSLTDASAEVLEHFFASNDTMRTLLLEGNPSISPSHLETVKNMNSQRSVLMTLKEKEQRIAAELESLAAAPPTDNNNSGKSPSLDFSNANITDADLGHILTAAQKIPNHTRLKSISFKNNKLSDREGHNLHLFVCDHIFLEKVDLSNSKYLSEKMIADIRGACAVNKVLSDISMDTDATINATGMAIDDRSGTNVAILMRRSKNLRHLNLNRNRLTDVAGREIMAAFQLNAEIRSVTMEDNLLTSDLMESFQMLCLARQHRDDQYRSLIAKLNAGTEVSVSLGSYSLTQGQIHDLAEALKNTKSVVTTIDLHGCGLSNEDVAVLAKCLPPTVRSWNLSDNVYLSDTCVTTIVEVVQRIDSLVDVRITKTHITPAGMRSVHTQCLLADTLNKMKQNTCSCANLSGLDLQDQHLKRILKCAEECKTVETLLLDDNDFTDTLLVPFVQVYEHHPTLRRVDIGNNPRVTLALLDIYEILNQQNTYNITGQQKRDLLEQMLTRLKTNEELREVDLQGMTLTDADITPVLLAVESRVPKNIESVNLSDNRLTSDGAQQILRLVKHIGSITNVNLTRNVHVSNIVIDEIESICHTNRLIHTLLSAANPMESLNYSNLRLSDHRVAELCEALRVVSLRKLDLSKNAFSNESLEKIFGIFTENKSLVDIGVIGNESITPALKDKFTHLSERRLLRDTQLPLIKDAIERDVAFCVDISNIDFSEDQLRQVISMLECTQRTRVLVAKNVTFSSENASLTHRIIARNDRLVEFEVGPQASTEANQILQMAQEMCKIRNSPCAALNFIRFTEVLSQTLEKRKGLKTLLTAAVCREITNDKEIYAARMIQRLYRKLHARRKRKSLTLHDKFSWTHFISTEKKALRLHALKVIIRVLRRNKARRCVERKAFSKRVLSMSEDLWERKAHEEARQLALGIGKTKTAGTHSGQYSAVAAWVLDVSYLHLAAVKIQSSIRVYLAKKRSGHVKKVRTEAAIAAHLAKINKAATTIQTFLKAKESCRKKIRAEFQHQTLVRLARVQGILRWKKACHMRNTLIKHKKIQAHVLLVSRFLRSRESRSITRLLMKAKEEGSAGLIQRTFRCSRSRQVMTSKRSDSKERAKREIEELMQKELNENAIIIQRGFRQRMLRRLATQRKDVERTQRKFAMFRLQRLCRGFLGRKLIGVRRANRLRQVRSAHTAAAVIIQRIGRGYMIRHRAFLARLSLGLPRNIREQADAAVKIQSHYRGYLSRRATELQKEEESNAAMCIQHAYRRKNQRVEAKRMETERKAATKIQCAFRGHTAREKYLLIRYEQQLEQELLANQNKTPRMICESPRNKKMSGSRFVNNKRNSIAANLLPAHLTLALCDDEEINRQDMLLDEAEAFAEVIEVERETLQVLVVYLENRDTLFALEQRLRQMEISDEKTARVELIWSWRESVLGPDDTADLRENMEFLEGIEHQARMDLKSQFDKLRGTLLQQREYVVQQQLAKEATEARRAQWSKTLDPLRDQPISAELRHLIRDRRRSKSERQVNLLMDNMSRAQRVREESMLLSALPITLGPIVRTEAERRAEEQYRQKKRDELQRVVANRAGELRSVTAENKVMKAQEQKRELSNKREMVAKMRAKTPLIMQIQGAKEAQTGFAGSSSLTSSFDMPTPTKSSPKKSMASEWRSSSRPPTREEKAERERNKELLHQIQEYRKQQRLEAESFQMEQHEKQQTMFKATRSLIRSKTEISSINPQDSSSLSSTKKNPSLAAKISPCDERVVRDFFLFHIHNPQRVNVDLVHSKDPLTSHIHGDVIEKQRIAMLSEPSQAIESLTEILQQCKHNFALISDEEKQVVSLALNNLAVCCKKVGDPQKGLRYIAEALEVEESMSGTDHTPGTLLNASALFTAMNDGVSACTYARKALELLRARIPVMDEAEAMKSKPMMVRGLYNLAMGQILIPKERGHAGGTLDNAVQLSKIYFGDHAALTKQVVDAQKILLSK
eukprot:PhF_6_TR15959/c0_g1_i2/m.24877